MADTQKRNRLDELQTYCEWLEHKIASLEGKHIDYREVFDRERERTRRGLQLLGLWCCFLAVAVALLLAGRLWQ